MSRRPNFELLRDAFAIIDGIPVESLRLWRWFDTNEGASCGTIACAAGWLSLHPDMRAKGFSSIKSECFPSGEPSFDGMTGFTAIRRFFGLDTTTQALFEARECGYLDDELTLGQMDTLSDVQLFKRRVLRLFQNHNEPFDPKVGEGLLLDQRIPA